MFILDNSVERAEYNNSTKENMRLGGREGMKEGKRDSENWRGAVGGQRGGKVWARLGLAASTGYYAACM